MEQEQFNLDQMFLEDQDLRNQINNIPDRFGFKIGDVAKILNVKPYILRYWESEFSFLKPKKAKNQQRYYTKKDIEKVIIIKKLLYEHKFSIKGAKNVFARMKKTYKDNSKRIQDDLNFHQIASSLESLHQKIQQTKKELSSM